MQRMDMWKKNREPVQNMPGFAKIQTRSGSKMVKTGDKMMASNGDINAADPKELAQKISAIYDMVSSGEITGGYGGDAAFDEDSREAVRQEKTKRHQSLKAAFGEPSGDRMKVMGEVFTEELWETMNREGFTSQVLSRKDVADGVDNRIRIRRKDVVAFQLMNNATTIESVIEQPYVYPQDYYLTCRVTVEDRELAQAGPELLDEKFQDALEATMVRQDRILRSLFEATTGVFNLPIGFATFTPQVLSALRTQVASNGIPAVHAVFAFDLWDDMIADPNFTAWWEPVHKYQLIMEGRLGSILNLKLITDGFRYPTLRVLQPGEIYVLGSPVNLGQRGVRKELSMTEINLFNLGIPVRGWFGEAIESMHVMDRAVAIGKRL